MDKDNRDSRHICQQQDIGDDAYLAIYDADTNELLYSDTIFTDAVNADITFQVHKTFTNENILVTMSVNGGIFYTEDADNIYRDCVYIEYGNTANTFTNTGLNYGLSVVYGLRCSLTNLACYAKDLFALPLWYMLGSEMMMERMTSERINKWTVDRKQAEELKAFYDAEAEKALKAAKPARAGDSGRDFGLRRPSAIPRRRWPLGLRSESSAP